MKDIKVFYSELSGRFYASSSYRISDTGIVTITGKKYDVTDDIGAAITTHEVTFKAIDKKKKEPPPPMTQPPHTPNLVTL